MQDVHQHTFENGLTLVAQSMPWLASAAFSLYVPAGCRFDPADKIGTANFVCEMVQRVFLGSREQLLVQLFGERRKLTKRERKLLKKVLEEQA